MTGLLVQDWGDRRTAEFLVRPLAFPHNLISDPHTAGMFDDAGLANLLETHPDELTDVNIYDIDAAGRARVRTGSRAGLKGPELLAAIQQGRLWINLRNVCRRHPAFAAISDRLFADLARLNPGFKATSSTAQLLISSPTNRVAYHADMPGVVLLHLRGRKRIWIYPVDQTHLPDEAMEKAALRITTEDLPYKPDFDAAAEVFDLEPGMAVAWPINAPHRVDNLGTFNVSLSIEYMTWPARLRHGVYYTHGTLRRFGFKPPSSEQVSRPGALARWALAGALKKLQVNRMAQATFRPEFDIAPDARDGARERAV